MKNILKIFDKYSFCIWAIVILLVVSVVLVPFTPGRLPAVFGLAIPLTPVLVLLPMLLGIIYAVIASYEEPKMPESRKNIFRVLKAATFVLFYALTIAVIVYAAMTGKIRL